LSILAALLGWTKLPPWALELIVIGLVAGGIWYWHHATLERGIAQGVAKQVTADDAATAKVKEKAARDTAALRARGEAAEKAYAQAQLDLQAYRSAHPVGPVVLGGVCNDASHDSGPGLSGTPPAQSGNESSRPNPGPVQPVRAGTRAVGPVRAGRDLGPMLDAFALAADRLSDELREYQSREVTP